MTKSQVIALLKANQNDRGLANWKKMGPEETGGLKSYGIGLTVLRKLAKQIGRDHQLAGKLWQTPNHDAKVIALLIEDPKAMTRQQAEEQVDEVEPGMLAHVFSSCDATLPKTPFAFDLAQEWMVCKDVQRRSCGYGLIYELSKNQRDPRLTDAFFLDCIQRISDEIEDEVSWVRLAMGGALIGIGKRSEPLNKAAVKLAKRLGPIDYDPGDSNCEPLNVIKHLTSDYLKKKLGL